MAKTKRKSASRPHARRAHTSIEYWSMSPNMGIRVVWYRDDDGNSGNGFNPRVAYWYCQDIAEATAMAARGAPPRGTHWFYPRESSWRPTAMGVMEGRDFD